MSASEINTDQLIADLKRVVRDSEELLAATANVAGEKAQEMRGRLNATLDSAKAACHRLEQKAVESAKAADKVIRDHPYQSIGIAFGVGILLGVLVTRK